MYTKFIYIHTDKYDLNDEHYGYDRNQLSVTLDGDAEFDDFIMNLGKDFFGGPDEYIILDENDEETGERFFVVSIEKPLIYSVYLGNDPLPVFCSADYNEAFSHAAYASISPIHNGKQIKITTTNTENNEIITEQLFKK